MLSLLFYHYDYYQYRNHVNDSTEYCYRLELLLLTIILLRINTLYPQDNI